MASLAEQPHFQSRSDDRFFLWSAFAMAIVIFAGFSVQLAMGRSSFNVPLLVHAHALVFMGWVCLYLLQNVFAATGNRAMHKQLGWLAVGWIPLMVILGLMITASKVRAGQAPFFFQPQLFLISNPLGLLAFVGLSGTAIAMRRHTDWHRRLHLCGMATLLGPGFGRLLPMPLMIPYAYQIAFAVGMIFPIAGIVADKRRSGRIHTAWVWGLGVMLGTLAVAQLMTFSPLGDSIYAAVTAGTPGASIPGLAFPLPPGPPPA